MEDTGISIKLTELLSDMIKAINDGKMDESLQEDIYNRLIGEPDPEAVRCLFLGHWIRQNYIFQEFSTENFE